MTLGGATGDDVSGVVTTNCFGDNSVQLILGCWYPTSLTASRCYWSFGATNRLAVNATNTDELTLFTNNTTPGQWVTSDADVATGQWHYIAALFAAENTTVPGACRMWLASETRYLTELTVTNTVTRSGNYTGGGTFTIGNAATGGTVAFQGDIGWATVLYCNNVAAESGLLPIATSGVITDAEADHIRKRWVEPFFLGQPNAAFLANAYGSVNQNFTALHWPGMGVYGYLYENGGLATPLTFTIGGTSVFSGRAPFTQPPHTWLVQNPLVNIL